MGKREASSQARESVEFVGFVEFMELLEFVELIEFAERDGDSWRQMEIHRDRWR
jgi:hypothetical protein